MFMLVPLDSDDTQSASITSIEAQKAMALLELEPHGEVIEITFIDDVDDALAKGVDYLIVDRPDQDLQTFYEYDVSVLLADPAMSIDDILEAFLFRTLSELA